MTNRRRICDLCRGTSFELICNRDRHGKPLETVVCLCCGLVGHARVPTEEELADYYARCYRLEYHGEERPSSRRIWRAHLKGKRVLRRLRPYVEPGARVFEAGAGLGCTVKVFEKAGFDASGIEPGRSFQRFSQHELCARVQPGSLADYHAPAPFDLVLFIHVIEHMRSPREALQAIHRLLKPSGRLYLECPSLGTLCSKISELFHIAHIHTFTPIPLLTLVRQCGFEVEKCFSDGVGDNHRYLLRKTVPLPCPIDPAGLAQTREFLQRFQVPCRRMSLPYMRRRLRLIRRYLKEFLWGRRAVRRILRKARQSGQRNTDRCA